jgi:hypothetical protein
MSPQLLGSHRPGRIVAYAAMKDRLFYLDQDRHVGGAIVDRHGGQKLRVAHYLGAAVDRQSFLGTTNMRPIGGVSRIFDFNAKTADGALDFCMTEQTSY